MPVSIWLFWFASSFSVAWRSVTAWAYCCAAHCDFWLAICACAARSASSWASAPMNWRRSENSVKLAAPRSTSSCDPIPVYAATARLDSSDVARAVMASAASLACFASRSFAWVCCRRTCAWLYCSTIWSS